MVDHRADSNTDGFYVTLVTATGSTIKRVEGVSLTVGRAEDCNLTISHETISRRHLTISLRQGICHVEDHGSSNGTWVNGKRLAAHTAMALKPQDLICMGQSGVKLKASAEPVIPSDLGAAQSVDKAGFESGHEASAEIVRQAQKKAITLAQEAEAEAERRVQEVYRRAHEAEARAQENHQKSREESQRIIDASRQNADQIRVEAERWAAEQKSKAEKDSEDILSKAQVGADELKERKLKEAETLLKAKEEELMREGRARLEDEHKDLAEAVRQAKAELKALSELLGREKATLRDTEAQVRQLQDEAQKLRREFETGRAAVVGINQQLVELRSDRDRLSRLKHEAEDQTKAVVIEPMPLQAIVARSAPSQMVVAPDAKLDAPPEGLSVDDDQITAQVGLGRRLVRPLAAATLSMLLVIGGLTVYERFPEFSEPLKRGVASVRQGLKSETGSEMPVMPTQRDLRPTYVDNVVHTEHFVRVYTSEDFQRKLLSEATAQLVQTVHADEKKVAETVRIAKGLVLKLAEQQMSPEKMRETESKAEDQMRMLLGSQAALESFKKLEQQFYKSYQPSIGEPAQPHTF